MDSGRFILGPLGNVLQIARRIADVEEDAERVCLKIIVEDREWRGR
jgi:hypothetical protein